MADDTQQEQGIPQELPKETPIWVQELLDTQKKQQEEIASLKADRAMLLDMAGKNKIASWKEGMKDHSQKFAHLKSWNGKVIVGYGRLDLTKRNPVAKDAVTENIFIPLHFLDGTQESINYSDFTNIKDIVKVKILENRGEHCTIQFEDETQMTTETKYLNP